MYCIPKGMAYRCDVVAHLPVLGSCCCLLQSPMYLHDLILQLLGLAERVCT